VNVAIQAGLSVLDYDSRTQIPESPNREAREQTDFGVAQVWSLNASLRCHVELDWDELWSLKRSGIIDPDATGIRVVTRL
jgi:hypothetical protein